MLLATVAGSSGCTAFCRAARQETASINHHGMISSRQPTTARLHQQQQTTTQHLIIINSGYNNRFINTTSLVRR